jgi:hypothetical protein
MSSKANLGAYGVMYVVQNKKSQVVALLLKNGVVVPSNATDIQIALLVTNLLKVSKSFYRDFSALLLSQEVVTGMSSNMSGSYANVVGDGQTFDFSVFQGGTPTTTTPTTTATNTSSPSWLNQGLGMLQTGFQGYLQLDDNKTKRALADASVKISESQPTETPLTAKAGMSTGAIVGLSVLGIAVVGLVVYLINKNK